MVQGSRRRGHVAPSQVGSQLEVEITKTWGWGSPRPKILLLFWGRVSGGSSRLPGLPACPAALSVLQGGFPVTPPLRAPDPLLALGVHLPTNLPGDSWAKSTEGAAAWAQQPFTIQPRPSLLLVKAFFSSVHLSLFFSASVGLSLLLGRGGALRLGHFPGRPSILVGGSGEGKTCRALPGADLVPNTLPPETPRELKTLCEEEEEGRLQPRQAGEAQAGVGVGLG